MSIILATAAKDFAGVFAKLGYKILLMRPYFCLKTEENHLVFKNGDNNE